MQDRRSGIIHGFIKMTASDRCHACDGDGACGSCLGSGKYELPGLEEKIPCEICDGTGRCPTCGGDGLSPFMDQPAETIGDLIKRATVGVEVPRL